MSTVNIVATAEPDNLPPRIRLDVTDVGSPNLFSVTVNRLDPDGRLVPVRTTDGNPLTLTTSGINRVGLLYDYEMPYDAVVTYSTVEDPATSSAEATIPETRAWLIHPGVPTLSTPITIAKMGARTRRVERGVLYPMGRKTPVTQTDGARKAAEYDLSIYTPTGDALETLDSLLDDAGALLLNVSPNNGWGVTAEYVSVGDVTEGRIVNYLGEPARVWELPCTVIDRPAGGTQAQRTYIDLLAYPTYTALQAAYPDYLALLAGP